MALGTVWYQEEEYKGGGHMFDDCGSVDLHLHEIYNKDDGRVH